MKYFRISTAFVLIGFSVFFLFQNCASKDQVFEATPAPPATPAANDSASTTAPTGTTSTTVGTTAGAEYNAPVPVVIPPAIPTDAAPGAIIGNIDGIAFKSAGNYVVWGWACAKGFSGALKVRFFKGAYSDSNSVPVVGDQVANIASDDSEAINRICGTTGNHRFEIPIPESVINGQKSATAAVYPVHVYGLNPAANSGGNGNVMLEGSGIVKIAANFGKVFGRVDGIVRDASGIQSIYGWTCAKGILNPLSTHFYIHKKDATTGVVSEVYLKETVANISSEAAVAAICQTVGANYRFSIPITSEMVTNYKLSPIYIFGIGLVTGYYPLDNPALSEGDGVYLIPEDTAQTKALKVEHVDLINSNFNALLSTYDDFREYTLSQLCKYVDSKYEGAPSTATAECVDIAGLTQPVHFCHNFGSGGACGTNYNQEVDTIGICHGKVISKMDCYYKMER